MQKGKFMSKVVYKITSIFFIVFLFLYFFGYYKTYMEQREYYIDRIRNVLFSACDALISDDFEQHASWFSADSENNSDEGNYTKISFLNDIEKLKISGSSAIYFSDYAPQKASCSAYIETASDNPLSEKTVVHFNMHLPRYLPEYLANKYLIRLSDSIHNVYMHLTFEDMMKFISGDVFQNTVGLYNMDMDTGKENPPFYFLKKPAREDVWGYYKRLL